MPKKKPLEGKPEVHKDLDGFEMNINEFGEITTNTDIDKLNKFLNKNVEDKKFKGLEELPYAKLGDEEDDDDAEDTKEEAEDLTEISDEFEEFRQFNDKDFKDEFDFDDKDEKDAYAFDEGKHMYEDLDDDDTGKKKKAKDDEEEDDIDEEDTIDDLADEFGEEDNYNIDDGDLDEKY